MSEDLIVILTIKDFWRACWVIFAEGQSRVNFRGPDKKHPVLTGAVKSGAVKKTPYTYWSTDKKHPVLTAAVKSGAVKKRPEKLRSWEILAHNSQTLLSKSSKNNVKVSWW